MGKTLDEMLTDLPAARRRKIKARGAELVAQEMTLRDLRKVAGRTQAQLARTTGKPQATISRMEAQSDMLLSNLNQVVEAMGGRIRIMAELPGHTPVILTGLGDLLPTVKARVRSLGKAAPAAGAKAKALRSRQKSEKKASKDDTAHLRAVAQSA